MFNCVAKSKKVWPKCSFTLLRRFNNAFASTILEGRSCVETSNCVHSRFFFKFDIFEHSCPFSDVSLLDWIFKKFNQNEKIFLVYYKFCLVKYCHFQLFWSPVRPQIWCIAWFLYFMCPKNVIFLWNFNIQWFLFIRKYQKVTKSGLAKLCTLCNTLKIIFHIFGVCCVMVVVVLHKVQCVLPGSKKYLLNIIL